MITVLGIGPGNPQEMLVGTRDYLRQADQVIGSARQLAVFSDLPKAKQKRLPHLAELKTYLEAHKQDQIVLLASGDPLLYGIGSWVKRNFSASEVEIVPGISSIQYMFNRLQLSMNDCYLTSSHGRQPDFDFLLRHQKIAMVTDSVIGPYQIAQAIKAHQQHRLIYIGERLSYPNEKISRETEQTVEDRQYAMNVVIITNA